MPTGIGSCVDWCALGGLEELDDAGPDALFSDELDRHCLAHVVRLNDELGWTFSEIARWLEWVAEGDLPLYEALAIEDPADLERREREQSLLLEACG